MIINNPNKQGGSNILMSLLQMLGGRFGPKNNWKAEVSGGKGRAGFNIAKLF